MKIYIHVIMIIDQFKIVFNMFNGVSQAYYMVSNIPNQKNVIAKLTMYYL